MKKINLALALHLLLLGSCSTTAIYQPMMNSLVDINQLKETEWSCPTCTYLNPSTQHECEICKHPRLQTTISTVVISTATTTTHSRQCSFCSCANKNDRTACGLCHTKKEEEEDKQDENQITKTKVAPTLVLCLSGFNELGDVDEKAFDKLEEKIGQSNNRFVFFVPNRNTHLSLNIQVDVIITALNEYLQNHFCSRIVMIGFSQGGVLTGMILHSLQSNSVLWYNSIVAVIVVQSPLNGAQLPISLSLELKPEFSKLFNKLAVEFLTFLDNSNSSGTQLVYATPGFKELFPDTEQIKKCQLGIKTFVENKKFLYIFFSENDEWLSINTQQATNIVDAKTQLNVKFIKSFTNHGGALVNEKNVENIVEILQFCRYCKMKNKVI